MRSKIRIDAMTESDVPAVAAVDPSAQLEEGSLRDELGRSWSRTWVAREGSGDAAEIVGFLSAWHVADELHVLNVTTRVDRRRRGIGRALMETAVAYGRAKRVRHVLLEARRSNHAALALYRSLGFFATGVRARYYPDDEDAVEMVLLFDPATGEVVLREDETKLD
jgi:[ribosomal protein S18]-alanine N-acetyltransferase